MVNSHLWLLVTRTAFFFIFLGVLYAGCKKNNSSNSSNNGPSITPYYIAPIPGELKVNTTSLTLHVNNTASITPTQLAADGTPVTSGSLTWQSSDNDIATVTSGMVKARALGTCGLTVTDGIHMTQNIFVTVVPDTTVLSGSPVQISWAGSGDFLVVEPGKSATLPAYTLYSANGAAVSTPVTYVAPTGSGLVMPAGVMSQTTQ